MESNHFCDIRRKLAEQLSVSARLYSEAVVDLTRFPSLTSAQFAKLSEAAEKAQERAVEARLQFEKHVKWHRCGLTYRAASAAGSAPPTCSEGSGDSLTRAPLDGLR